MELVEGTVGVASLATSVLDAGDDLVVFPFALVKVVVLGGANELEVREVVVERVPVDVVNLVSGWDGSVGLLPGPSVGGFGMDLAASGLTPSDVLAAFDDSSPHALNVAKNRAGSPSARTGHPGSHSHAVTVSNPSAGGVPLGVRFVPLPPP
jgi:hypothetical protein